jgi:hypothetical protein
MAVNCHLWLGRAKGVAQAELSVVEPAQIKTIRPVLF